MTRSSSCRRSNPPRQGSHQSMAPDMPWLATRHCHRLALPPMSAEFGNAPDQKVDHAETVASCVVPPRDPRGPDGALPAPVFRSAKRETWLCTAADNTPIAPRELPWPPGVVLIELGEVVRDARLRQPHRSLARALAHMPAPALAAGLEHAASALETGTYEFGPRRPRRIPKRGSTGCRTLRTFVSPVDRVVDRWLMQRLRPLLPDAPDKLPLRAVRGVQTWARQGYCHVRRFDFVDYFDSVDIDVLLAQLRDLGVPPHLLRLVRSYVEAPSVHRDRDQENGHGLPQGGSTSALLALVYTRPLRLAMEAMGEVKLSLFTDDGILATRSPGSLAAAERTLRRASRRLRLRLHPEKRWRGTIDEGVPFLGFIITPSSLEIGRDRVDRFRARLRRKIRGARSISEAVKSANRGIDGELRIGGVRVSWLRYYAHATDFAPFKLLDRVVRGAMRGRFGKRLSNNRLTQLGLRSVYVRAQRLHERGR
jgi:hypothetical protein